MILVDTNLFILLVVGLTNPDYIEGHRRLNGYSSFDFDWLYAQYSDSDDVAVIPHVLTEVSNLTARPARHDIRRTFSELIGIATELYVDSKAVVERPEFQFLGLTDTVILHLCTQGSPENALKLLTTDERLANEVLSQGGSVVHYPDPSIVE